MGLRMRKWIIAAAAIVSACGVVSGKGGDSETHWLSRCNSDAECGTAGACICGLCTIACDTTAACNEGPPGSTCIQGSQATICSADQSVGGVCIVECATNGDCASNQICVSNACVQGEPQPTTNPTGDCVATGTGAHVGYSQPGAGDVWLPDCQNPLKREYYRVFAQSATSAYVIPRPDGATGLLEPCNDPSHALATLVAKYGLCQSAQTQEQVDLINHMLPEDALTITHYLHNVLVFTPTFVPAGIDPYPIPGDMLDACTMHPDLNSADLHAWCAAVQQYVDSGTDIGLTYPMTNGEPNMRLIGELVGRLNELYGIGPTCSPEEYPSSVCTECGLVGGCGMQELQCTRACSVDADCSGVSAGPYCMIGTCGPVTGCI